MACDANLLLWVIATGDAMVFAAGALIGWWAFGSSAGSERKTELAANGRES